MRVSRHQHAREDRSGTASSPERARPPAPAIRDAYGRAGLTLHLHARARAPPGVGTPSSQRRCRWPCGVSCEQSKSLTRLALVSQPSRKNSAHACSAKKGIRAIVGLSITASGSEFGFEKMISERRNGPSACNPNATREGIPQRSFGFSFGSLTLWLLCGLSQSSCFP